MDLASKRFGYFTLGLMATAFLINFCESAASFRNPILDIPNKDQYIYFHTDGYYYMTRPSGNDLYLYKSETLSDWRLAERKIIHTKNGTGTTYGQPEIHFLGGNWYIYYHSNAVASQFHVFVIEAQNPENPFGQYSDEIRLTPATPNEDYDDIDGTILEISSSGSLYLIYAGYAANNTEPRKIFIAPMSDPTTISGPRVLIRDTMSTWDTEVRSPQILRENENENQTFLVFTGYTTEGRDCLGLMRIQDEKDPLVASNWWHYPYGSVFASNSAANVYSPGYSSFTYSPDFSESWMAYRAKTTVDGTDSTSRLDKIEWNDDGTPRFPSPTALTIPLPLPSGEIS